VWRGAGFIVVDTDDIKATFEVLKSMILHVSLCKPRKLTAFGDGYGLCNIEAATFPRFDLHNAKYIRVPSDNVYFSAPHTEKRSDVCVDNSITMLFHIGDGDFLTVRPHHFVVQNRLGSKAAATGANDLR
jgi:hypothetical protein